VLNVMALVPIGINGLSVNTRRGVTQLECTLRGGTPCVMKRGQGTSSFCPARTAITIGFNGITPLAMHEKARHRSRKGRLSPARGEI
jgi:hypothetical protein